MSWAFGVLSDGREIGYSVEAECDQAGCSARIDRGLAYVCGSMHEGGDSGCGYYFCAEHLVSGCEPVEGEYCQLCSPCAQTNPDYDEVTAEKAVSV